jgi:lipopolysaccharide export system permease protein
MNKIFIYMLKKYLLGFLLTASILISINLLIIFLSELKNLGVNEYTLSIIAQYIFLLVPQNFLDIFPYALLIGSMIAFGSMAYHSEIIAINSHGVGIRKIILMIMFQTLMLSTTFTYFGDHISPGLSAQAQEIKNSALQKNTTNQDIWFKGKDYIINAKTMITYENLENIEIINISNGNIISILTAEEAIYNNYWILYGIKIIDVENNKIINKDTQILPSDKFIPSQILKSKFNNKRYQSIQDLYENIIFHNNLGIYYEDHKVIFWQKILLPFSCCIIVFIGIPFLFTKIRSTNQSQKIIFGILFGITYFVLSSILINIGLILKIPALLSVLISMGVFILLGYFLFEKLVKSHTPI